MTKPAAACRHCPGPSLPHAHTLPPNPATFMFRNRLWSRLNYRLCAERSREGAASQHPHPQHSGYAHSDPLVTLPPGPASPARLSRVRCPPGQWPCAPKASSSQELPVAQGPALFGGAESPLEPCGCNGQAVHQASQLAEAGSDATGLTAALGVPPALHPLGREVSDTQAQPQAPSSLLPASTQTPPGVHHPGPQVPLSPGLLSRRCPQLHIQPGLQFSSPRGQDGVSRVSPSLAVYSRDACASQGREAQHCATDLAPWPGVQTPSSATFPPPALTSLWPCR